MKISPQALRDGIGIVGIGLLAYGAWLASPPAGFITGGLCLFGMAIVGTLRGKG